MHVVVLGLGTAGAAAAAFLARSGVQVTGIDALPLEQTGARWVNGVPAWSFDAVGLERPSGPELRSPSAPFHLVAGWGGPSITAPSVLEVDMRHLTTRLLDAARGAGAELRGGVRVRQVDGGRVELPDGTLQADVVVDATGHAGLRLLGQPKVPAHDLCAAAQEVREVADPDAAAAFFRERGAQPGEVVCFTGIAGGYSILNTRLDGRHVGLLSGSIAGSEHPSGAAILKRFVADNPWIGPRLFGGQRSIPLRRPLEVIGWGRTVSLGDSASMVFAAHGSGVAQQLLAARVLARELASGGDAWSVNVAWQRAHGGLLASSDLLRRASEGLSIDDLAVLMQRGVMSPGMSSDTMAQRPPRPPLRAVLRAGRGLAKLPKQARRMVPPLVRGRLVEAHYRRYPSRPEGLPRWRAQLERLTGQPTWAPTTTL